MRLRLIVNPRAAAGRARNELPRICSALRRASVHCDVAETTGRGHASELARQAIADGVDVLAVMGGDGTLNEVVQAFGDPHGRPVTGPELVFVPFGTGGDFRRNFRWDQDPGQAIERILRGSPTRVDLGAARTHHAGLPSLRYFINVCSFGVSGLVTRWVNAGSKRWGGKLTFYLAAARATLVYENQPVQLSVDGQVVLETPVYLAAFCNGRYFGGGMQIAPQAELGDGLLDCVVHGDLSRLEAYALTRAMYDGSHVRRSKAHCFRGRSFRLSPLPAASSMPDTASTSSRAVPVELDGETAELLPLEIDVLPAALCLRV
jgi:YegS/Rv2252/BmrU family lipid kinase